MSSLRFLLPLLICELFSLFGCLLCYQYLFMKRADVLFAFLRSVAFLIADLRSLSRFLQQQVITREVVAGDLQAPEGSKPSNLAVVTVRYASSCDHGHSAA